MFTVSVHVRACVCADYKLISFCFQGSSMLLQLLLFLRELPTRHVHKVNPTNQQCSKELNREKLFYSSYFLSLLCFRHSLLSILRGSVHLSLIWLLFSCLRRAPISHLLSHTPVKSARGNLK